jgi:hypothetical protein
VTLPQSLATGTYNIVAVVDSTGAVAGDTNLANNTVTSSGTIAVAQGLGDLSGSTFGTSTLPTALASGAALKGSISVVVENVGNLALPAGQLVTIQLVAYDMTTDLPTTLVTTGDLSVSALAATNGKKTFSVPVDFATGLSSDDYQYQAIITPVNNLTEFTAPSGYPVFRNASGNPLDLTVS